jgi:aspartate-semialdehyde dehydrogenase
MSATAHDGSTSRWGSIMDGRTVKVGVLGATGTVGQRFLTLLARHPFFVIEALGASARSAHKPYHNAVHWKQTTPIPPSVREMIVKECVPKHFSTCDLVFSGLDADVAGDIGENPLEPGFFTFFLGGGN